MRVSILTPDSKKPNLAAMKISTYHKAQGDEVRINFPLLPADKTYASIIFDDTILPPADVYGGPGYNPAVRLPDIIEKCKPDYSLYPNIDYSLGYTYRACHRGCGFCKVKDMNEPIDHRSIWSFHEKKFKKIALLNNNTFEDPKWRDTFEEIWDAGLKLKDVSGFDARLMNPDRAFAIAKTRFVGKFHIAWDFIKDNEQIFKGLQIMFDAGVKAYKIMCYVLIGFDTTEEEDLYRIERLRDWKIDPFVMPFDKTNLYQEKLARYVNHKAIFNTVEWKDYR